MDTKVCIRCSEEKALEDFHACNRNKDGKKPDCTSCRKVENAVIWARRKAKEPNLSRDRARVYRKENYERYRHLKLMRDYNISLEDYNEMFAQQKGCCAICKTHQSELKRVLGVDHNHETSKVRGLLCDACNTAIGSLRDNVDLLEAAIDYLLIHDYE